jgi:uncharacterized protein
LKAITEKISIKLNKAEWQITNALSLMNEGATIPFIARYRKEKTGGLTDIELLEIEKINKQFIHLEERKITVLKSLEEQGVLTDELKKKVSEAETINQVEDIYLPYKPKRKTKATIAKSKDLEPLARMIYSEKIRDIDSAAAKFISTQKDVNSIEEALQGARDIIAEWISENAKIRETIRFHFQRNAVITSKVVKTKEEEKESEKYKAYNDWEEKASKAPSHRILAMFRGEKSGFLKLKISPDKEYVKNKISNYLIKGYGEAADQKEKALDDSIKRLLFPSIENEYRNELKEKADEEAIRVFSENLKQLLLAPPLGQKNVMAIDPGFRTGCKVVCLDKNGNLKHNETIYPHPPQNKKADAIKKIKSLVSAYKIEAIAIGNGTAGRETEDLIRHIRFNKDLIAVMVNENGASVYSASETAREEFPDYDVTVRGAVSIGRRLMDPLSELVKIDPKSIGVGQYQHDVNQKLLQESLTKTVELCVNAVGVELNTASKELLTYVSGLGQVLAKRIIEYRKIHGDFKTREELKNVKGLGVKAFQQAAGFLRIKNGKNILDASAVHPERYNVVEKMATKLNMELKKMIGNKAVRENINLEDFVADDLGLPTLNDIIDELEKPGRDPRKRFKQFEFDKNIRTIEDIRSGMILNGIIVNITNFGAFVDLGIHENGLLHKSQIANEFVSDPAEYLKLNQEIKVKVVDVNIESKRISLSMKY